MSNKNRENIGCRIAKLRELRKLSQAQLATELGKIGLNVRRETVTQWENGTRDLKTDYTIKLAEFFGVSCDFILRGIEADNISVAEKTGLTNEAITQIHTLSLMDRCGKFDISYVQNKVISIGYARMMFCFSVFMEKCYDVTKAEKAILKELELNHEIIPENLEESIGLWYIDPISPMNQLSKVYMDAYDQRDLAFLRLEKCIRDIAKKLREEIENG